MTERSLFWDGIVLGDCGPYSTSHVHDRFFRALLNGTGDQGVLRGWLNELEVTGTSSPVSVATGAAIVYGLFYENDAAATQSIPTPAAGFQRVDYVVIRRDWATQTARIARVIGTANAAGGPRLIPTLTQTAGGVYEIPLSAVYIDDAGTISAGDVRDYVTFATEWPAGAVDTEHYAPGGVTAADVPDRTRYDLKGAGQIEPDSTNAATWTAGASYDYWQFADAVTDSVWVYFMPPTGLVGASVDIYVWSVPDVNGAGAGAENCQWDYNVYYGPSGGTLNTANATVNVDQQARVNTTVYADALISALGTNAGNIIILQLDRDGAADSYNSAMRLLGIECRWTADA